MSELNKNTEITELENESQDEFVEDELLMALLYREPIYTGENGDLIQWDEDFIGNASKLYYKDLYESTRILSEEEELHYAGLLKNGTQVEQKIAEEMLIKSMLRYVIKIAKMYTKRGVDFEDLLQEGNIGLITAVRKFDPTKSRLSTYSTWWIRQRIARAVMEKGRTIRIPSHAHSDIRKFLSAERELESNGVNATDEVVAYRSGLTVEQVRTIRVWITDVTSLDSPLQRDGIIDGTTLVEFVEDPNAKVSEINFMKNELRQALENLAEKEREVLILRFGLDGYGSERSLQEVGKMMGFTRERARQIEKKALTKLRKSHHTKHLVDYLTD